MAWPRRGFQFSEVMAGTYALTADPDRERRFAFELTARAPSLLTHLRDGAMEITGTLDMEGFATGAPIAGSLVMAPLVRRVIGYDFEFCADDRARYRFTGQKNIKFMRLRASFTTLPGRVVDADGREVASVLSTFDVDRDLKRFVASWRRS